MTDAAPKSSSSGAGSAGGVTTHPLERESELRLEVSESGPAFLKLLEGNAEIFGAELLEGKTYTLAAGRKVAVFTWYGAQVQCSGAIQSSYISDETSMPAYANLHQRLEARREEARAAGQAGPRVLLVGPTDSGKSSLARVLVSYAARVGRCPLLVDLDVGQGDISIPGTVAAAAVDRSCLSLEGSGGLAHTGVVPLVHFFGHTTPSELLEVYRNSVARLGESACKRAAAGAGAGSSRGGSGGGSSGAAAPAAAVELCSGMIINTMGWVDGAGYGLLIDAARAFAVDVIVVLGHDKVFARLVEDAKTLMPAAAAAQPPIAVVKLSKPGGVVERAPAVRKDARRARLREYFYGAAPAHPGAPPELSPVSLTLPFDAVTVVRVGGSASESSILPIGKASTLDPLRTRQLPPGPSLLHQVLAVSFAASEKQVPHANVAGFVHVTGVDAEQRTLTVLAPTAGALPGRFLVLGDIKLVD